MAWKGIPFVEVSVLLASFGAVSSWKNQACRPGVRYDDINCLEELCSVESGVGGLVSKVIGLA